MTGYVKRRSLLSVWREGCETRRIAYRKTPLSKGRSSADEAVWSGKCEQGKPSSVLLSLFHILTFALASPRDPSLIAGTSRLETIRTLPADVHICTASASQRLHRAVAAPVLCWRMVTDKLVGTIQRRSETRTTSLSPNRYLRDGREDMRFPRRGNTKVRVTAILHTPVST